MKMKGNLLKKIRNALLHFTLGAAITGFTGCASVNKPDASLESRVNVREKKSATWNVLLGLAYLPAAWFAGVAAHEGGHALSAYASGAESVNVSFPFSYRDEDGDGEKSFYAAQYSYKGELNKQERMTTSAFGPGINYLLGEMTDELIKYRVIAGKAEQPAAVFALANKGIFYHSILDSFFSRESDLRKVADEAGFDPSFYTIPAALDILINFKDYQNLFKAAIGEPYNTTEETTSYMILPLDDGLAVGAAIKFN